MNIQNEIKQVISMFDRVKATFENNNNTISEADKYTNDYLHSLEFTNIKDVETVFLENCELKEQRKKRREAKDENLLLQELYTFVVNNEIIKSTFSQMLSNYNKKSNGLDTRKYATRTDKFTEIEKEEHNDDFKKQLNDFKIKMKAKKKHKYL